jgi:hypothetical protein
MTANRATNEWWARITHEFESHVRDESHLLEAYERAAEEADDPGVVFLLKMILEDEHRHHATFSTIADALIGAGDGLPTAPNPSAATVAALLEPTETFLAAERDDQRKLRALRKDLGPAREVTLWPLVVELMEIDTQKHIRMLEYLHARLQRAAKG